jgi:Raf kinase inhibitor-like YbhB/YbcL family protein
MQITSPAFLNGQTMPVKYSCDGEGVNPPLVFSGVPIKAKSLALIVDDPDVPKNLKPDGLFVHWVLYNITPDTKILAEDSQNAGSLGLNSAGAPGFTAPCPPDGQHRYFFKLYALDTILDFFQPPTKDDLENAIAGHVIAQAKLVGLYSRKQ